MGETGSALSKLNIDEDDLRLVGMTGAGGGGGGAITNGAGEFLFDDEDEVAPPNAPEIKINKFVN